MTPNELSIEKIFLILRLHLRLIISIFTIAVVTAGTITYLAPKMYKATASLNFSFSANPVDSRGRTEFSEKTYISTQMGIIKSQQVAQRVEDSLTEYERERLITALNSEHSVIDELSSLLKSPIRLLFKDKKNRTHEPSTSNGETLEINAGYGWLAQRVRWGISVEPIVNTRIVELSYSSTDRKIAALMANKFAEAYIATNLDMITNPARRSKAWFDEQLITLRKSLEEAQSRLTAYQQKEGVVSADERLDTENSRLQNLSNQLVATQQETRNAVTQRQKLKEVLDSGASLTTFGPVFDNAVVQRIKAVIRDLQGTIVEKSSSLGVNHPTMKRLKSELYAARERLKSEIQTITDGIDNAAELSSERERDLQKALEAQKQLVLGLKNERNSIAVLQREVESAQATYNAALNQLNSTNMQSMVDQTNVSVVDRPVVPSKPSSPRVMKNLVLGVLAGLLLGIGLAIFLEMFTRRVHSTEDITAELGMPLLAHLQKV